MNGRAYYNEIDPFAAQWLRNLIEAGHIAPGDVDERSIVDVRPGDLAGYTQCHFFAGIGGWSYALRLAGWPDDQPVWTGSCPCQPFSLAGKQKGFADERHLWPEWFRLISDRRPATVFGEQVASAKLWLDQVFHDLEAESYACGASVLPACSVDAPHQRNRMWFVANTAGARSFPGSYCRVCGDQTRCRSRHGESERFCSARTPGLVADPDCVPAIGSSIPWRQRDPWSAEPAVGCVVDGVSHKLVEPALRCLGNAIVPQVAAQFILAATEAINEAAS